MKFFIKDSDGNHIFSSTEPKCEKCTLNSKETPTLVPKCDLANNLECRHAKLNNKNGEFFICGTKFEIRNNKVFLEKLEIYQHSLKSFLKIRDDVKAFEEEKSRVSYNKIIHNIKNINGQNIQSIYEAIPMLIQNRDTALQTIIDRMEENPKRLAVTILQLLKNFNKIKTEFIAQEKLSIDKPTINKSSHDIRSVILNIYQSFYLEFRDQKVELKIPRDEKRLNIDFDTMSVAFYHIFQNAAKYIKKSSDLVIQFFENDSGAFKIIFIMKSLPIEEDEMDLIFVEGYSGKNAKKMKLEGKGVGMFHVKKALKLNNATIEVECGKDRKQDYAQNKFIISFAKK